MLLITEPSLQPQENIFNRGEKKGTGWGASGWQNTCLAFEALSHIPNTVEKDKEL